MFKKEGTAKYADIDSGINATMSRKMKEKIIKKNTEARFKVSYFRISNSYYIPIKIVLVNYIYIADLLTKIAKSHYNILYLH